MEDNGKPQEFTTKVAQVRIMIDGKQYTVRELTGRARDAHLDELKDRSIMNSEGQVINYKTYQGCQSGLLAKTVFDENGELVPLETLQEWPASTVDGLHEISRKLSKLAVTDEVKDQSKKE